MSLLDRAARFLAQQVDRLGDRLRQVAAAIRWRRPEALGLRGAAIFCHRRRALDLRADRPGALQLRLAEVFALEPRAVSTGKQTGGNRFGCCPGLPGPGRKSARKAGIAQWSGSRTEAPADEVTCHESRRRALQASDA